MQRELPASRAAPAEAAGRLSCCGPIQPVRKTRTIRSTKLRKYRSLDRADGHRTQTYLSSAKAVGLTEAERTEIASAIANSPQAGELIVGSGGARKLRFAGRGKGKSGGYRVITYYAAEDVPVFLLDVYSKGQRANLSDAEVNELRTILADLADLWRAGARRRARERRTR